MDCPAPPEQDDMEVWRDAWEQEMSTRPSHLQLSFPDQSLFNSADEARKIIRLLERHGIPSCITGVKALCYFGVARLCLVRTWS